MQVSPNSAPSLLPYSNMAINFQEISQATAGELCRLADWVKSRMEQESERIAHQNDEKTRGDEIDCC
jgi:hypothetical protein